MEHSTYISEDFPIPASWNAEEFWGCVQKMEQLNEVELFDFASRLGIQYELRLRGKVLPHELIPVIFEEGGSKEEILAILGGYFDASV